MNDNIYGSLSLVIAGAILLGSVMAWNHLIARLRAGEPALEFRPRRNVPWNMLAILSMVFFTLGTNVVLLGILRRFAGVGPPADIAEFTPRDTSLTILILSVSSVVALLVTLGLLRATTDCDGQDLGLLPPNLVNDVGLGVNAFLLLSAPVFGLQMLLSLIWREDHPLVKVILDDPSIEFFVYSAISAACIAPVVEEFFFRLLVQGWLEKLDRMVHQLPAEDRPPAAIAPPTGDDVDEEYDRDTENPYLIPFGSPLAEPRGKRQADERPGTYLPVIASSLLFALAHFGQGPAPVPLFFLALGLGYLYRQTHRIMPCIVVHFLVNSVSLLNLWLYVKAEG